MSGGRQRSILMTALVLAAALLASSPAPAATAKQTLTGEVGDAMCGSKHMEGGPEDCTRTCIAHGSKYALVVGEKVYTIETTDKSVLALLDQRAGKNVTITGTINGSSIEVSSAVAAK